MKTRNIILYAILLIAYMVLAGCAGGSEPQVQENVQESTAVVETEEVVDVELGGETEEVVAVDEPTEKPISETPKPFFQQSSDREISGEPGWFDYPVDWAFCVEPGQFYRVAVKDKEPQYYGTPYVRVRSDETGVEAKIEVFNLDDDSIVSESEWITLSNPAPMGYRYLGGISNSVWFEIDDSIPFESQTNAESGEVIILFRVDLRFCLELDSFLAFSLRVKGLEDSGGPLMMIYDNELAVPTLEGIVYQGRFAIVRIVGEGMEILTSTDWIDLPTLEDFD